MDLFTYLPICRSIGLSIYLSTYLLCPISHLLSIYLPICLSAYLPFFYLPMYLSFAYQLSTHPSPMDWFVSVAVEIHLATNRHMMANGMSNRHLYFPATAATERYFSAFLFQVPLGFPSSANVKLDFIIIMCCLIVLTHICHCYHCVSVCDIIVIV